MDSYLSSVAARSNPRTARFLFSSSGNSPSGRHFTLMNLLCITLYSAVYVRLLEKAIKKSNYKFLPKTKCYWIRSEFKKDNSYIYLAEINGEFYTKFHKDINYSDIKSFWNIESAREFLKKMNDNGYRGYIVVENHIFNK